MQQFIVYNLYLLNDYVKKNTLMDFILFLYGKERKND